MKAAETNIRGLLQGGKQYSIPLFQRPYSWNKDNWAILWEDILSIYNDEVSDDSKGTTHFLGPIVTVARRGTPDGISPYTVIDGQQRLSTLSVLLSSLRDYMKETNGEGKFVDELHNLYIINQYKEGQKQFKIIPTKTDREIYQEIILEKTANIARGHHILRDAYLFFRDQLNQGNPEDSSSFDLIKLRNVILERLDVVHITLDMKDNPYIIFESLNYKGTPLTQADLVRNYFFMNLPQERLDEIYAELWYPVQKQFEESAGHKYLDELTNAFWYYLRKDGSRATSKQVYQGIKERFEHPGQVIDDASLRDLLQFAEYYNRFRDPKVEPNPHLQQWFDRFRRLGFTTSYPLLLNLYDKYDQGQLSLTEFEEMLQIIESYFVRRLFVGSPTNVLNKLFNSLYNQIENDLSTKSLVDTFSSYSGNRIWPDDNQFQKGIIEAPVYTPNQAGRVKLILKSLNGALTKEQVDPTELTIEHVMPQTLTDEWKAVLGPGAEEQNAMWGDNLGNLTLIHKDTNSGISNKTFREKLDILRESNVSLNRYFWDIELWDIEAIKQRGARLGELAIKVWPR